MYTFSEHLTIMASIPECISGKEMMEIEVKDKNHMGTVTIQNRTTIDPITCIGEEAGICWGANVEDKEANYKRGIDCIKCNHGRTMEFPEIYMILNNYSSKVIREFYTHIIGVSRLQSSTRYIDYSKKFEHVIPESVKRSLLYIEEIPFGPQRFTMISFFRQKMWNFTGTAW